MLLIVGGSQDHNINRLAHAAEARGAAHRVIHTDAQPAPSVTWSPGSTTITINGESFDAKGTSLFIRYDVFGDVSDAQKSAFFDTIKGWAAAYPDVGILNRANETLEMSKPRALVEAERCGFDIPKTTITNDFNLFANRTDFIAKPVSGGAFTKVLSDMPDTVDQPYIVQEKLSYPEMRLFRVGEHYFAFEIQSEVVDYRANDNFSMVEVPAPDKLVLALSLLSNKLGLDYAAADLKTNPKTGTLEFLEINTMPMFTGYDNVAEGRLSDAMFLTLRNLGADTAKAPAVKPAFKMK